MKIIIENFLKRFPYLNLLVRAYKSYYITDRELQYYKYLCDPQKLSIDVGVAWGAIAFWMKKYSKGVILFEPNPFFSPYIKAYFIGENDKYYPTALSSEKINTSLVIPQKRLGRSTIDKINQQNLNEEFRNLSKVGIETMLLNDLKDSNVNFIKIDVEGHEYEVLQGAKELITNNKPHFQIEIEERHHPGSFSKVFKLLETYGYRCYGVGKTRLVDINQSNYKNFQSNQKEYIYNFIFSCDSKLISKLKSL